MAVAGRPDKTGRIRSTAGNANPRGRGAPRRKPARQGRKPPGLKEYLAGDITYKSQLSDIKRNRKNFLTDWAGDREDVKETFADTFQKMQRERANARSSMSNDFQSRGLIHSGLFAKADSDYNKDWSIRANELRDDRGERMEDLKTGKRLFLEETRGVARNARDEAIRRRAQRYGLR